VLPGVGDFATAVDEMQRYLALVPDAPDARSTRQGLCVATKALLHGDLAHRTRIKETCTLQMEKFVSNAVPMSLPKQPSPKDLCRIGLFAGILFCALLPSSAFAQPAAEWSQMKAACRNSGGSPASEYYNEWVTGGGCVCNGSPSHQPTCPSSSSSSTTSSDSTTNALAGALTSGLRGLTPQQVMGVGITALAISALMQTPDPQQQAADQAAEAAKQAALQRQHEQQRQEQEQRAEATKQELLHTLKGTSASTDLALKDTGAGAELQLKTGDSSPPTKAVIHDGFSLPMSEPYQQ
jgi:hypothetical protein